MIRIFSSTHMIPRLIIPASPIRLVFVLLFFTCLNCGAVPDGVKESFQQRYGSPDSIEWEVDDHGFWEAEFKHDGDSYRADFRESGEWIETERSVKFEDLPEPVRVAIRKENGDRELAEVEEVDNAEKGRFYDIEFKEQGPNEDIEYDSEGKRLAGMLPDMGERLPSIERQKSDLSTMTPGSLVIEFGLNLLTILIYACAIHYRRHHDHKMMFLLLAFNLFLFPIFLLSSVLTMGFGFTIFALLALVRLRSENFDKAEVAYLLGAVALTFINSQLSAHAEIAASAIVLLTAYVADHPYLWRSAYQSTEIRYRISETTRMLDREHLAKVISSDFGIDVNDVEIVRVDRKEVRVRVVYNDLPPDPPKKKRKAKKSKKSKKMEAASSDEALGAEPQNSEPLPT